jgi:hypothetical protein
MEAGRLQNLEALTAHIQNLEALRDERFAEEDGPAIDEVRRRAMLGSVGSKSAERLRRYETGHALDLHRSLATLAKLRKEADRNPAPAAGGSEWSPASRAEALAPNEANEAEGAAPNEANEANEAAAPNEANGAEGVDENHAFEATCDDAFGPIPPADASPDAPEQAPTAAPEWA